MPIVEILEAHSRKGGMRDMRTHCACGWKSADCDFGDMFHRAHVVEVLEQHMANQNREAQAKALDESANESYGLHINDHMAVAEWLKRRAKKIREGKL
ncbi:hypothetical protein [Glutamicibacter sp. X7]